MKIIVNDIVAVPNSGGVFSVLTDFYKEVIEYNQVHHNVDWIFLLAGNYIEETSQIKVMTFPEIKNSWLKRLEFEFFTGRKLINELHADVYISLQNTMTMGVDIGQKWTYLHQPLPYQNEISFSVFKKLERKMWIYQHLVGAIINFTLKHSSTKIVVQTQWMKTALLNKKIANRNRIIVLPPNNIDVKSIVSVSKVDTSSFFYPATGMPYKNHQVLFEAVRQLEHLGFKFSVLCTLTDRDISALKLDVPNSVKLIGMVPRETVLDEYQKRILVFPSLLETFGLPLLEARLSNAYVLAGNTSFGREILDGYPNVDFFEPRSVRDLVLKMKSCLENDIQIKAVENNVNKKKSKSLIDVMVGAIDEK